TTKEQFRLEGENYTGWLGGDYRYKKILLGAAVAYDHAETRFESPGDHQGTVTTQLGGFYPYWRLMPNERVSLWGVMGFGWGMLELNEQGVEARTAPLRMQVYAGGLRADVLRVYGVDVAAKGDASYAIFRTSARPSLPAVESRPGRLRLALEGQRGFALGVHSLTPSAELGFRLDYNDAASGAGLEMGGGLLYRHQTLRLTANMRARGLVTHRNENLEEWGVSLLVRMEPDALGRGLFASLQPSWGRTASRREALWGEQNSLTDSPLLAARQSEPFRLQPSRLDAELGYGFLVWQERGRLSPFAQWGFALDGLQRVQLGSRLQLGDALGLEAFTERRTAPALPTDYEFGLRLNMRL
ncbi:MAG: autotransporter domain-containing protein, partial [Hyphomicrobiales bacterium]|nr:autotransporter domain-containing protein [Hyphomicrobiales bacterium]